jgi:hypothetical protein
MQNMRKRVQQAVLSELSSRGILRWEAIAVRVPGADTRDLAVALENLLDEGAIEGSAAGAESLMTQAQAGRLRLTPLGRQLLADSE